MAYIVITFLLSWFAAPIGQNPSSIIKVSDRLEILAISDKVYIHKSFLDIPNYGKFECNGLIYAESGNAYVFDTPTDTLASQELIHWIKSNLKAEIEGVIVNHFHDDCLGGLAAFHKMGIPSYCTRRTAELAAKKNLTVPTNIFEEKLILKLHGSPIENRYFGEAHTGDNIISWLPEEQVLFGGCIVKSMNAGKGNLADANVQEWPKTVQKIKGAYPNVKVVVPGHGAYGDKQLLDYTIQLFQ